MDAQANPGVDPASQIEIEPLAPRGRVLDLARLTGPILAIGSVVAALAVCSAFLRFSGVKVPLKLDPADPLMSNGFQEEIGAKLAALVREGWGTRGPSSPGLGVLIGASSTRYGFDPAILEAGSASPMRWINLSVEGSNASDVYRLARMILPSGIRPDVIVMGLHQEMLPRSVNFLEDETSLQLDDLKLDLSQGDLLTGFEDLGHLAVAAINRAFPGRRYVTYLYREIAIEAKVKNFRRIGIGVTGLFTPDPTPWKPPHLRRARWATTANLGEIPAPLAVTMKEKGWLLGDHYQIEDPNPQAVLHLIDDCDREDVRLVIVLTPQLTLIRDLLPRQSLDCLNRLLGGSEGRRPEVLDLRTAIPETHFRDVLHVDDRGRDEASRLLAAYLFEEYVDKIPE